MAAQGQKLLYQLLRRQLAQAHGGQFQRQRQPVESDAQRGQRQQVVVGQGEGRIGRGGPGQQQLQRR